MGRQIVLYTRVPCGEDVMRSGFGKDVFGLRNLPPVATVNGDQDVTRVDLTFVIPGVGLGEAEADQAASNAADRRTGCGSTPGITKVKSTRVTS